VRASFCERAVGGGESCDKRESEDMFNGQRLGSQSCVMEMGEYEKPWISHVGAIQS